MIDTLVTKANVDGGYDLAMRLKRIDALRDEESSTTRDSHHLVICAGFLERFTCVVFPGSRHGASSLRR